jgi:hypothetical protein
MMNLPEVRVMPKATRKPAVMSRSEIINALRKELVTLAKGEMSVCRVAQEQGLLCRGFARYTDAELKRRYDWIVRRRPKMSRAELEEIADRWQLARQDVEGFPSSCDVQQKVHDTCGGWDDFTNDDLARYYFEITGKEVRVQ